MIEIMQMSAAHVCEVASLEKVCFSDPWSERSISGELDNPLALWLVAKIDNKVVGYIGSQSVMGEADMMNLAVDPDFRCRGIGAELVTALLAYLQERGVSSLTLEVRQSNEKAKRLYSRLGFSEIGRRPNYYRNPREDALILRKEWSI